MTMTWELGDVIAERLIVAVSGDGSRTDVVLRVGKPAPDPLPGGDWGCPWQIAGLGDEAVDVTFGVDSLQALLLAVYAVRVTLAERADRAAVRLDWFGVPGLGLQVDPELSPPPA
jgi:hypothetical protein